MPRCRPYPNSSAPNGKPLLSSLMNILQDKLVKSPINSTAGKNHSSILLQFKESELESQKAEALKEPESVGKAIRSASAKFCTLLLLFKFWLLKPFSPLSNLSFAKKDTDKVLENSTNLLQGPQRCEQNPPGFKAFLQEFLDERKYRKSSNNSSNSSDKDQLFLCSSAADPMNRRCLCDTIYPIIKLSQFTGLIPLSIKHTRNSDGRKIGDCQLQFKWKSIGNISNTLLLMVFLGTLPFAYQEIRKRMSQIFHGTDLYAFTFQSLAMVVETTVILIASRCYKKKFTEGWAELNSVYHAMCDSADSLSRVKLAAYVGSIVILSETACFVCLTFWTTTESEGMFGTCIATYIGIFYIQLTTLLPYIISSLFFFICLLIRAHFLSIASMIQTLVERERQHKCGRLASSIDSMRVLHEQLCSAVKSFEAFFGVQVLLTLCTCCFTMVIGAYALIIQGEGISAPNSSAVTTTWGTQLYCAAVFILLMLISGQLVANSANASAPVLNAIPLTDLDEQSQRQVIAFLHKISAFPMKMTAVNITNISTTFLASAATNITTYLLVLMQFKLTIENKAAVESQIHELLGSEEVELTNASLFMDTAAAMRNITNFH